MRDISQKKIIHSCQFDVRWGDTDSYGHVNNTIYFLYTQEARFKLMIDNGIQITPSSTGPVLASTSCKFIYPIKYPDNIIIDTYLVQIKNKKILFEHVIRSSSDSDKVYAIAEAVCVWFDFRLNQSIEVPEDVLAKLISDI